jgi:predicted nucleic-acid-binding protein
MKTKRIFADTNLFLRYLTNDLPVQASAFENVLQRASTGEFSLVTNALVIAEIVWTLESYYRLEKLAIEQKVLAILNTPGLEVIDETIVLQAITWYAEKNVDFIDAHHAAWMLSQGITDVYTFDANHFSRLEGLAVQIPK